MAEANGAERMILSNLPVVRQSHTYSGGRSLRRRLSTFPVDKPFEKLEPAAPIAEVVLRLVVDLYSEAPLVVGSATVLCGHLLVTAKHVLLSVPGCAASSSVGSTSRGSGITVDRGLAAVQVLPGPEYVIWDVISAIAHPGSDLALLRTSSNPRKGDPDKPHRWNAPKVNPFAPQVDERVAAFGYRQGLARASRDTAGGLHIVVEDNFMSSVGIVREIHEWRRDQAMLPFPCYQVSARFDAGMSGGPVFDEFGSLCGLVCAGIDGSHETGEPISFVTTLWPLFTLIIDGDRGDDYPRGVQYPAIELARDGQIHIAGRTRLMDWFRAHIDQGLGP